MTQKDECLVYFVRFFAVEERGLPYVHVRGPHVDAKPMWLGDIDKLTDNEQMVVACARSAYWASAPTCLSWMVRVEHFGNRLTITTRPTEEAGG